MKFTLVILGAPGSDQSAATALRFAHAAIANGDQIFRIFLYHDGVHNSSKLVTPPQGEVNLPQQWQNLAKTHNIDIVTCIASSLRRGILDAEEAERYDKACSNIEETSFKLSGLGELVDATISSDQIITFGN